jgi:excisionase family DNA binding protein
VAFGGLCLCAKFFAHMPYLPKFRRPKPPLSPGASSVVRPIIEKPLTKSQVGELLEVSERYVEREIRSGALKAFKLGGRVRIMPSALEEWIASKLA